MQDWTRKLPAPVETGSRTLRTLADVRAFLLALPAEVQAERRCQAVAALAIEAAEAKAEPGAVATRFRLAQLHRIAE